MSLKQLFPLIIILCGFTACDQSDDPGDIQKTINDCDFETIVDANEYENINSDDFELSNIAIQDNCLSLEITASGCDGDSWEIRLIDSQAILESNPEQRNLKIDFTNQEDCRSTVSRTFSFDLNTVQINGNNVKLNIVNADKSILYDY
jgi:hypothetical protein